MTPLKKEQLSRFQEEKKEKKRIRITRKNTVRQGGGGA